VIAALLPRLAARVHTRFMIVECENCGAPLHVEVSDRMVACRYCQYANKVAGTRTLMAQTPCNWQPPPTWTPVQAQVARDAAKTVKSAVGIALLAPVILSAIGMLVAGGVVFAVASNSSSGSSGFPSLGPSWDGSAPFTCGGNDSVTLENVVASLPAQVAITVRDNCELTIINSTIVAGVGIEAGGNRDVALSGTTIQASEVGVRLDGNKHLVVAGGVVRSSGTAVEAGGNVPVTVQGGATLTGSPPLVTRANAHLIDQGGILLDERTGLTGGK